MNDPHIPAVQNIPMFHSVNDKLTAKHIGPFCFMNDLNIPAVKFSVFFCNYQIL